MTDPQTGFHHVLVTRFNVPLVLDISPRAQPVNRGLSAEWLEHRFGLFERFCLPSVRTQTCQKFTWLVWFDEKTPAPFRERIEKHAATWPVLRPCFVPNFDTSRLLQEITRECAAPEPWLLTTRLDNDDAIATDFMATVQKHVSPAQRNVINFPLGFSWSDGRVYLDRQRSNPFTTLVERAEGAMTIFSSDHRYLEKVAELKQVKAPPMWMQVIHDRNVCNQVRGVRWPVGTAKKRFALEASVWGADRPAQFLSESVRGVIGLARQKGVARVAREIGHVIGTQHGKNGE